MIKLFTAMIEQVGKRKGARARRGFTLIEILLVLTLLGLVFSILGRKIFSGFSRGKVQATKIQIKQIEGDLDRYRLDCNFYPTTDQGLKALLEAPTAGRKCKNYDPQGYLSAKSNKMPEDAWGNEFTYTCDDGINYTIKSMGADGVEGGDGDNADISSADE
jgi:general secretion pathway protein G